jgi:hypothetical protein
MKADMFSARHVLDDFFRQFDFESALACAGLDVEQFVELAMDSIKILAASVAPYPRSHGDSEIEPFFAVDVPDTLALARFNKNRRFGERTHVALSARHYM